MTAASGRDQAGVDIFRRNRGRSFAFAFGQSGMSKEIGHSRRVQRIARNCLIRRRNLAGIRVDRETSRDRLLD
jgi:hypothetical protein